jgi:hypothetical protein
MLSGYVDWPLTADGGGKKSFSGNASPPDLPGKGRRLSALPIDLVCAAWYLSYV